MKNLNTYNLYQITSVNNITISSKRLSKNNFENTAYKNYNNSQKYIDVNVIYEF